MLFISSFSSYTEFQEIFGIRVFGEEKARKNKILLALLKDKKLFKESVRSGDLSLFSVKNLVDLRNIITKKLQISGARSHNLPYKIELLGQTYYSNKYKLDSMSGVCEDGTPNAVRYINMESGRVFKMKAGKFFKHLIESTKFGKTLNETLVIWLCEEFNRDWQAHVIGKLPKNKLYINDNFADIYDSTRLKGYDTNSDAFISCMVDKDLHSFYKNAVNAKAAYLEDENGKIIARCVIFTEVYDENDDVWRYAERQYSVDCNDVYKQALVDALIQAGEIDCFKKVGASCHDSTAIVDINGNSLANKRFHIDCDLNWDDKLSYQDTFKWYSMYYHRAYNYEAGDYALDVTEGSLEASENNDDEPDEYDSYHERNAWEVCTCYYHGNEETVDVEDREDFINFKGKWYHEDDIVTCPKCGEKMLNPDYYGADDDVYYSEITKKGYCDPDCRDEAENEFKAEHWYHSDYDGEYYMYANDITTYMHYNSITCGYEEKTISKDSFFDLIEHEELHEWGGVYFDVINEEVGKPYGYETLLPGVCRYLVNPGFKWSFASNSTASTRAEYAFYLSPFLPK